MIKITREQFEAAPHISEPLEVGDRIIWNGGLGSFKIGKLVSVNERESWFEWDNGDSNTYIDTRFLIGSRSNRVRLYVEPKPEVPEIPSDELITKILNAYTSEKCPYWDVGAKGCLDFIKASLLKETNPAEYKLFMKLKSKYEP